MSNAPFTDRALVQILSCLPSDQMRMLKGFVKSELHGGTPLLADVLESLDEGLNKGGKRALSVEWLIQKLEIAPTTLEKSLSQLLTLVREFAGEIGRRNADLMHAGLSLDYLHQNGIGNHLLEIEWRKHKKRLQAKPESITLLLEQFELADAMAKVEVAFERKNPKRDFGEHISSLEQLYVTTRLKYHCAQLNEWRVLGGEKPVLNVEILVQRLGGAVKTSLGILGTAYINAQQMLEAEGPIFPDIQAFAEFLKANQGQIESGELRDLYGYLLNCSFRGLNQGIPRFQAILQEIYLEMYTQKMLQTGKYLDGGHFKNLISILLRNEEWELAKGLIEKGDRDLAPIEAKALLPYAKGLLDFHQSRYASAASWFRRVLNENPKDAFWGIEARVMLWKALFEGGDVRQEGVLDELEQHYDAFRVFISRNKTLSDYHKRSYGNFARFFYRLAYVLADLNPEKQKEGLRKLEVEANGQMDIANRKWLLAAIHRRLE